MLQVKQIRMKQKLINVENQIYFDKAKYQGHSLAKTASIQ